ncbi:MAG: DUF1345 domain-containing protein [Cryobacterium sp.]|uniref:DUF1345 domain-containing protein n=1 Tax=unclassified Cryobacterium TaxID=2649013 RepID=UPI001A281844|nr:MULTISPECIES: DUF1345 domain-containing protein [unclassified Cryobacterium]MCY7404345.1 DUF1345 domain-containing protein [Cryobacterium sp.]
MTIPLAHLHRYSTRLVVMLVVGIVVGVAAGLPGDWALAVILGWAAACVTYIGWVWIVIGRQDADSTASHAIREDPSRGASEFLILFAGLASLGAIVVLLLGTPATSGSQRGLLAGVAIASVALSWVLVHTLFTLRYASLYYSDSPGGIDFNQTEAPRYSDFAYLAFTIGMTYQVSDTSIQNHSLRMTTLRHALLSFPFGSVILATLINLVAGLLH